ncbi:hypothetical protein [uncultured Kordia sp.]|uniref:hypothetical protein n=1 Tax=uncultured Kordia sp. TaxID=507699 RepID=UPI0026059FE0|nr:hypothetical protein [uncultured Kordia sp.]
MKRKSIVLRLRKSKIANFNSIYGGATNPCNSPSQGTTDPNPSPTSQGVKGCSGTGKNDQPSTTDTE